MNDYGDKISVEGVDVKTAAYKDLISSSQFTSPLILNSGTLTINLPSETITAATEDVHESSYSHGLGYIPLFLPILFGVIAYVDADVTTGGNYVANDLAGVDIPVLGYGLDVTEDVSVIITDEDIIFRVTRYDQTGTITFGSRTATLYYTLFHNRIDEEFNFL